MTLAPLLPPMPTSRSHTLTGLIPGLEAELEALDRAIGVYADLSLRGLGAASYDESQAMHQVAVSGYRKAIREFALAVRRTSG